MYKLLIVDDEDVEREGMAEFVHWEEEGITLCGTAWNGVEGYEEIQNQMPDIVITDIKMPVMNGLELIRKTKEDFPEIRFVVLSGYGEYEYTSRAMELGVHHYILKPCDEEKILSVMRKVIEELKQERKKKEEEHEIRSQIKRLAPRAREQMFRNLLLGREDINRDLEAYLKEVGKQSVRIFLLIFHKEKWFDHLEQFVAANIISELLGREYVLMTAAIQKDAVFLLDETVYREIRPVIDKVKKEYEKFDVSALTEEVSECGHLEDIHRLYESARGRLSLSGMDRNQEKLWRGFYKDLKQEELLLVNYHAIGRASSYDQVLFEIYLALVKLRIEESVSPSVPASEKESPFYLAFLYAFSILYEEEDNKTWLDTYFTYNEKAFLEALTDRICQKQNIQAPGEKEEKRIRQILLEIYKNIKNPELSISWLTKKVLYMNEDHFGRIFSRYMKQKYSTYVLGVRIELAKRLIWYFPEIKLSQIAEEVGYPPDGQYFSKTFHKVTGMSPSEYRESIRG